MSLDSDIRKDFRNLLYIIWKHQGLPDPAPIQYEMAHWLQHGPGLEAGDGDRIQNQAMRGAAKTMIGCAFACWWLYNWPNDSVLLVSASQPKANDFAHLIRSWIRTVPILRPMIPLDDGRDNLFKFDVGTRTVTSASASVTSYGITGQITGGRANLIVGDDIEVPDNSQTQEQRKKLRDKMTEFESILVPGGKIILNGTPQSEESVYTALADAYKVRQWPARYPVLSDEVGTRNLSPMLLENLRSGKAKALDPTYPERFSDEDLTKREQAMGSSKFRLQFLLRTDLADAERYPLKLRDFVVMGLSHRVAPLSVGWASGPNQRLKDIPSVGFGSDQFYGPMQVDDRVSEYTDSVMYIDPSGSGPDETAYTIGKLLGGNIFILKNGARGGKGTEQKGTDIEVLTYFAEQCYELEVKRVIVEKNFGDGMYAKIFYPVLMDVYKRMNHVWKNKRPPQMVPEIIDDTVKGQKETRIIADLEPLMNSHKIILNQPVAEDRDLMYQITRITTERGCLEHDDRVDSFSGCVRHLAKNLHIDPAKLRADMDAEEALEEIMAFHRHGRKQISEDTMRLGLGRMDSGWVVPWENRRPPTFT